MGFLSPMDDDLFPLHFLKVMCFHNVRTSIYFFIARKKISKKRELSI